MLQNLVIIGDENVSWCNDIWEKNVDNIQIPAEK